MSPQNSGLGRGLGSLIPNKRLKDLPAGVAAPATLPPLSVSDVLDKHERIWQLPVENVAPNPHQPRKDFSPESLEELANSIKEHGIISPLIVTEAGKNQWQIIAGERRWRAAKMIGLEKVPAVVRELSEQKKMEVALIENLQRQNLNVLEVAMAYEKLIDEFNLSQEELGKKVGKSRSAVANAIRILNVRDEVKQAILAGKISEGHARVLAGLPAEDQLEVLEKILSNNFSVRETERAGKEVVVKKHIRKVSFDPEVKAREEDLQRVLGTKVEIKKFGPSGQIIIKFFSDEELEEIYRKII
jgi:ParB family chromosome partitioning protein